MSRADDKIKKIYEDARAAMKRLSDKNYRYVGQDSVYDDLRTVQKLIDSSEEVEWYWKNKLDEMTHLEDGKDMACIVTGGYRLWPKEMLDNYIDVEFEGHMFSSVRDYDTMLRSTYGDYMKIPPESERVSYHDFVAYWK